jgi:hypothetical protein
MAFFSSAVALVGMMNRAGNWTRHHAQFWFWRVSLQSESKACSYSTLFLCATLVGEEIEEDTRRYLPGLLRISKLAS